VDQRAAHRGASADGRQHGDAGGDQDERASVCTCESASLSPSLSYGARVVVGERAACGLGMSSSLLFCCVSSPPAASVVQSPRFTSCAVPLRCSAFVSALLSPLGCVVAGGAAHSWRGVDDD
jgi:hypothetical protein